MAPQSWRRHRHVQDPCRSHPEIGVARYYPNRPVWRLYGAALRDTQPLPRLKACQSHATVERAGEAPRSSEVGSGIGSLRKSVGCTRRTAPLDVTSIASTSDPTARRGSTRILRHVRKSPRSRALLHDEQVKHYVALKLAAASTAPKKLSAAPRGRRRSALL